MVRTFIAFWKHLTKSKWRFVSYIILLFIPFIYGFIYMNAYWAPFKHSKDLRVAIVNLNKGNKGADDALLSIIKDGKKIMQEIKGSGFTIEADLVLLAMGFLGPKKNKLLTELKIELDERGNVKTNNKKMTNIPGLFAAGDMRRGQSLVVWAIYEGREVAKYVNKYILHQ